MTPRLPGSADWPPSVRALVTLVPPQQPGHQPKNILLLLHGLGDDVASFVQLGRALNLPHTCCIVVRGPAALPFDLGGYHWGDDIHFDPSRPDGGMDMDSGFQQAVRLLRHDIIDRTLVQQCGYTDRDVMLLGLGQGAMAALACAVSGHGSTELGGVVSVGGPLPAEHASTSAAARSSTPVLVCHGSSRSAITTSAAQALKQKFGDIAFSEWPRAGDGMMRNRDEMLPVMRFFARRLRTPAPPGTVDVTLAT